MKNTKWIDLGIKDKLAIASACAAFLLWLGINRNSCICAFALERTRHSLDSWSEFGIQRISIWCINVLQVRISSNETRYARFPKRKGKIDE